MPRVPSLHALRGYGNALTGSQLDIIGRFRLHALKQCIGVGAEIEIDRIRRKDVRARLLEFPVLRVEIKTQFLSRYIGMSFPDAVFVEMFRFFRLIRLPTQIVPDKEAILR